MAVLNGAAHQYKGRLRMNKNYIFLLSAFIACTSMAMNERSIIATKHSVVLHDEEEALKGLDQHIKEQVQAVTNNANSKAILEPVLKVINNALNACAQERKLSCEDLEQKYRLFCSDKKVLTPIDANQHHPHTICGYDCTQDGNQIALLEKCPSAGYPVLCVWQCLTTGWKKQASIGLCRNFDYIRWVDNDKKLLVFKQYGCSPENSAYHLYDDQMEKVRYGDLRDVLAYRKNIPNGKTSYEVKDGQTSQFTTDTRVIQIKQTEVAIREKPLPSLTKIAADRYLKADVYEILAAEFNEKAKDKSNL